MILTGSKGIGKTTALEYLLRGKTAAGIETYAVWGDNAHPDAVFMRDLSTGETAQIGSFENGKMQCVEKGFLTLGIQAVNNAINSADPIVKIDEIGFLETEIPEYCAAVEALFDKKTVFAAVRKQPLVFFQKLCRRGDVCAVDLDDLYERNYAK